MVSALDRSFLERSWSAAMAAFDRNAETHKNFRRRPGRNILLGLELLVFEGVTVESQTDVKR